MKSILSIIISLLIFTACQIDEIKPFGEQDYAYFDIDDKDGVLLDKNKFLMQDYSFLLEFDETIESSIINYPTRIAGTAKNYERHHSIQVVDSLTTALQGVHFELLPETEHTISEGSTTGLIKLKLLKTPDMAHEVYQLAIVIVDNDELKAGPTNRLILSFHNTMEKPYWWPSPQSDLNIGEFTITKCLLWMRFHELLDGSDPWEREPYATWRQNKPGEGDFFWNPNNQQRALSVSQFIRFIEEGDKNGQDYIDENGNKVLDTI